MYRFGFKENRTQIGVKVILGEAKCHSYQFPFNKFDQYYRFLHTHFQKTNTKS